MEKFKKNVCETFEAAMTVDSLLTVYVQDLQSVLEGSKFIRYSANVNISFVVNK